MKDFGINAAYGSAAIAVTLGSFRDDDFYFSSGKVSDFVLARGGNDTIDESGYLQYVSDDVYFGGAGNDNITTRTGADTIFAGAGNDVVVFYGDGASVARGGRGYDTAYIHSPTDNHPNAIDDDYPQQLRGFEEIIYL